MKATTLRALRRYHQYLGVMFAPAILFFAFSGALQTWDIHEPRGGAAPQQWISVIAALHKKQALPKPKAGRPPAKGAAAATSPAATPPPGYPFALKLFVGLMSIGLMISTLVGLTIAFTSPRGRLLSLALLAIGTALPVALILG